MPTVQYVTGWVLHVLDGDDDQIGIPQVGRQPLGAEQQRLTCGRNAIVRWAALGAGGNGAERSQRRECCEESRTDGHSHSGRSRVEWFSSQQVIRWSGYRLYASSARGFQCGFACRLPPDTCHLAP
jgi:hypothetical protein